MIDWMHGRCTLHELHGGRSLLAVPHVTCHMCHMCNGLSRRTTGRIITSDPYCVIATPPEQPGVLVLAHTRPTKRPKRMPGAPPAPVERRRDIWSLHDGRSCNIRPPGRHSRPTAPAVWRHGHTAAGGGAATAHVPWCVCNDGPASTASAFAAASAPLMDERPI